MRSSQQPGFQPFLGRTAIVIPCYNEAKRLNRFAFLRFARLSPNIRFFFVNDGSSDETSKVLNQVCAENPTAFRLIELPANQGKAEAVRIGMQAALKTHPIHVGYWDADLATSLLEIPNFTRILNQLPDADVVIGSRLRLLGRKISRNLWRANLSRSFSLAASATLGFRVRDTQCGAKMFRVSAPLERALAEPFGSRWIFDVELLARLVALHQPEKPCLIYENPLDSWTEVSGSKLRPHHFLKAIIELGGIYWKYSGSRLRSYCERVESGRVLDFLGQDHSAFSQRAKSA
jgi:glycosyltransferase involved in cell wall biosynthesis